MKRRDDIRIDFSAGSDRFREALRAELMQKLDQQTDQKEDIPMKRTMKYSTRVVLVAALAVVLVSASALAVANSLKLGPFATYLTVDHDQWSERTTERVNAHRADWEGKLYDKQGNLIDDLAAHIVQGDGRIYDANHVEVDWAIIDDKMEILPMGEDIDEDDPVTRFPTLAAAQPFMAFDVKLPTALPAGYVLDHCEMYSEKPELKNSPYLTVVFAKPGVKGSEVNLMLRLMNEETAFESSGSPLVHPIKVAGYDAVAEGNCLDVLVGDVLYAYFPMNSDLVLDDFIRMAESVR